MSASSPTQEAVIHRAAEFSGAAIEMQKATKNRTHFDNVKLKGLSSRLLSLTFGGWDGDKK